MVATQTSGKIGRVVIVGEFIWIIGASSGIGLALAQQLARSDNRVFVSARNVEALQTCARNETNIVVIPCDVTDPVSMEAAKAEILRHCDYLNRVIINAGVCEYFDIDRPDWSMMERVMRVNYFGALNTVQVALPLLERVKTFKLAARGQIVVTASLASEVAFPRAEAYGASKAALKYCFESLGVDLRKRGIDVAVVQPGFVDTPMTRQNDFPMPFKIDAASAANIIVQGMKKRRRSIRFPWRLSWILGVFAQWSGLWYRIATRHLVRFNKTA